MTSSLRHRCLWYTLHNESYTAVSVYTDCVAYVTLGSLASSLFLSLHDSVPVPAARAPFPFLFIFLSLSLSRLYTLHFTNIPCLVLSYRIPYYWLHLSFLALSHHISLNLAYLLLHKFTFICHALPLRDMNFTLCTYVLRIYTRAFILYTLDFYANYNT